MTQQDVFTNLLAAMHEAALDDARWPAAAHLIDEAGGSRGNELIVATGYGDDVSIHFAQFCYRGQRRRDFEHTFFGDYIFCDERLPRLRRLPDGRLTHVRELYTAQELKTSRTYNEALALSGCQNGLNMRLDGPAGTRIVWAFADPVDRAGWGSSQVSMIKRLVPHVRQFVRVRQALSAAGALGASVTELLDNSRFGVIQLDRKKRIVEANDRARDVLRRGDGLFDKGGVLSAWLPADDAELQRLLAAALPPFGNLGTSSSMTLRRAFGLPRLVLHASPVVSRSAEFPSQRVAALVVVVDPANRPRIDPDLVAAGMGLTPSESQVAAMLSEGWSVRDIARMTGRQENSVYKLLKQAYRKHGINRQVDLIRLVLSLAELPGQGR